MFGMTDMFGNDDMFGMTATEFVVMNNTDRDALREPWRVSRCSTWSRRATRTATSTQATSSRAVPLQARGRAGGAAPDRRAVRAAAHAQPARHGVLQQRAHAGVGGGGFRLVRCRSDAESCARLLPD